jgi:DNA-binding transcriptional regulator YhcF (GntR family)
MRWLRVDPSDAVPIWSQIEDGLRRLVATGALSAGQSVPSVRDLARDLSVNPATVAKAYQRLCDAGVLSVRRGDGTYVADRPPILSKSERARQLRTGAARYARLAATAGAGVEEAAAEVAAAFAEIDGKRPPGGKP